MLPCADCPGIRYQINLLPDSVFHFRMTYLERPAAAGLDDIGTWLLSSDGGTLILAGGREGQEKFAITGPQSLRKLDIAGDPIESSLPYDLERAAEFTSFAPRLTLSGMYSYLAAPHDPGAPVKVSLEGRLAARPKIDGEGTQPTLVVDRFIGIWPGETCPPRPTTAASPSRRSPPP